ncbi:MAG TPA: replicative DNA helicase [Solirubrobacteraceae bacterium]|nr:replicative DNA helicase [Solirubrobacteraceae bacterium]
MAETILPPHDLDAEQAVLGAILLSDRSLYALVIEEGLRPADFYHERHTRIYEAMLSLYNESQPVDPLTVTERLARMGHLEKVGGRGAIEELTGVVPAAGHARRYAQIVREAALLRRLLGATYEIQGEVAEHSAPPRELVERAERAILEVARDDRRQDFRSIEDVLHNELDKLHRLSLEGTRLTGTPSGFTDLDAITGGFQPGNLIIVAARPAMGKSALVCNIAENAAVKHNVPVALFSLEMAEAELAQRFVASQTPIKGEELRRGRVPESRWPKILKATQRLAAAPLWIDDSSDVGLLEIRAKARRLHSQREGGLGLIIVDYLQLMRTESRYDSRVTAVGELSRGLKILARELEVPVIAISQLSRAVEQRPDKKPMLSDLRESGNLEQDSDLVVFLYRDEYYNEDSERIGEADLMIAKHRNGALGTVTLTFQKDYPKFMNFASERSLGAGVGVGAGAPRRHERGQGGEVIEADFSRSGAADAGGFPEDEDYDF